MPVPDGYGRPADLGTELIHGVQQGFSFRVTGTVNNYGNAVMPTYGGMRANLRRNAFDFPPPFQGCPCSTNNAGHRERFSIYVAA